MRHNILVTGGAGFVGSHLCRRLVDEGHEVYCLDNFYTGTISSIAYLLSKDNFHLIQLDVLDLTDDISNIKFKYIYHLACPASPQHYQKRPYYTVQTCLQGTANVLKLMSKNTRLLVTSTSEVYGEPLVHPQHENYRGNVSTVGLRSCYDEGKRGMESMVMAHKREFGSDVAIVRIFNTYGPGMSPDDGRVVSNFIGQALKNTSITLYGSGDQTRSFCYVSDLVDGLIKMMMSNLTGPINIGNPTEITVSELAHLVVKLTDSSSEIIYKPLPEDDPTRRCPDIGLAKGLLNWEPKIKLDEGLIRTIEWFKKNE